MRRLTIRVRLTALFGALFFLAGTVLLGLTYVLLEQSLAQRMTPGANSITVAPSSLPIGQSPPPTVSSETRQQMLDMIRKEQEQFRTDTLDSLLAQGGVALGLVGVVALGFGWLMAERALRPVHEITATARRVAAAAADQRGLRERIALGGPRDEIKELADTFDEMLERLHQSFNGQRQFVANAAHEMRTPLALNRTLIEVTVTRPDVSADARGLGEALLSVNARHERLIDGLLTLAVSEHEVIESLPVDLRDIAQHVLDQTEAAAAEAGVELRTGTLCQAPTAGDLVLLERLTQNLVDNAVRHNLPGGWLTVTTELVDEWAVLTVSNTGPVVQPYELTAIFQPFRRLGGDRVGSGRGFGLGLSIVQAIVEAHHGSIKAVPRKLGGLETCVRLPARKCQ
jgi:signal transduction histidine kinase